MPDTPNRPQSTREAKRLAEHQARIGQVVSERYELLSLLGHGGMGAVYKARHIPLDRIVAVKFLLSDVADDPLMRKRFMREATASGKINHPNVVELIDYGEGPEGEAYIVIEFLDGISMDQVIRNERQIEYTRAVKIFDQICSGVAKAHARGIIHRDLKPSNIMLVTEQGEADFVKVVDFGLAKALDPGEESQRLTQSGEVFGSPIYMAPEQCMGRQLGPSSDIYAMGVLMYESLTGKVPIVGSNVAETIARQLNEIPKPFSEMRPDLQIPASLEAVVMKALSKDPDQRQASMLELKEELSSAMATRLQIKTLRAKTASIEKPARTTENSRPAAEVRTRKMSTANHSLTPLPTVPRQLLVYSLLGVSVVLAIGIVSGLSATHPGNGSVPVHTTPPAHHTALSPVIEEKSMPVNNVAAVHEPEVAKPSIKAKFKSTSDRKKAESKLVSSRKEEPIKIHKTHPRSLQPGHQERDDSDLSVSELSHKHHRDWHDFTNDYEKKEAYSHSWSVPVAGSKSQPDP